MNCPNCNNPLKPTDSFCGYCGTPVAQPLQPVQQQEWQPQQPAEQYQPPQQYQQTQQQYQQPQPYQPYQYTEPIPPKKSKTPIIVAIIVVAVLVAAGICAAIILPPIFNDNNTSSSTAAVEHRYLDSDGTVIAEDNDFNANDSATEKKLKNIIEKQGNLQTITDQLNAQMSGMGTLEISVKGNAIVYEIKLGMSLTDEMIEQMKPSMESAFEMMGSMMSSAIDMVKQGAGVDDIVFVIVYRDQNDKLILGKVLK